MKRIQINMVFRNIEDTFDYRIIYISYDYSDIVCIELNNGKALPYYDNTSNVESQIGNNELELLENDPYFKIYDESIISSKFLKMRDTAYDYIKILCSGDNLLNLCSEHKRGMLIKDINTKLGISKTTIYKNMNSFLNSAMFRMVIFIPFR